MNAIIHVHYKLIRSVTTDKKTTETVYIFVSVAYQSGTHWIYKILFLISKQRTSALCFLSWKLSLWKKKRMYLLSSYGVLTSCVINLFTLFNRLFFESVHKISTGFVLKNLSISVWIFFVCLVSIYWTTRFAASNRLYPTLISFYVSKIKSKNTINQS